MTLHRHRAPYVAVVLEGGYEESSMDGVWLCRSGDLVVHPPWHLHTDRFSSGPCRVLNLLIATCRATTLATASGVWHSRHTHAWSGAGKVNRDMVADILASAEPRPPKTVPKALAAFAEELRAEKHRPIAEIALRAGLSREYASRLYRRHFGFSPRAGRGEARLRSALALVAGTGTPLAEVALEAGFADQAHLTRRMHAATGWTPGRLRNVAQGQGEVTFVQ